MLTGNNGLFFRLFPFRGKECCVLLPLVRKDSSMFSYFAKAFSVWFIGFFPLAEIYVAVPSGLAMGLDPVSVVFWSVFGNFLPAILVTSFYEQIAGKGRVGRWLQGLASEKVSRKLNSHGFLFTALLTPWIGVWVIAATVKLFGMKTRLFLQASFVGLLVYAIVLAALLVLGFGISF